MVVKIGLISALFLLSMFASAQEKVSTETVAELTRRARSPDLSMDNKGKISEAVARYIQQSLSENSHLKNMNSKEFREFFTNNPEALNKIGIKGNDPLRHVISEFSQLINSIQVSEKLKQCKTGDQGVLNSISSKSGYEYSICDQGRTVQEFIVWDQKKSGSIIKNQIPGFLYFDHAQDLYAMKNIAEISTLKISSDPSDQLGKSLENIKSKNPEKDPVQVAKYLELRAESYLRAVTNAFKTIAMLRVLYQSPGLDVKDIDELKDELKVNCNSCSEKQIKYILNEVNVSLKREIQFNRKKHLGYKEISKTICSKLTSRGYLPQLKNEFDPSASDKDIHIRFDEKNGKIVNDTVSKKNDVTNLVKTLKSDSAKEDRRFQQSKNERDAILGTIGDGWEGLLLMTPQLTVKDMNNSPIRVNLDCLNLENPKNEELVSDAVSRARYSPIEYLQDLNRRVDFKNVEIDEVTDQLALLMNENHRAFGEAVLNQPEFSPIICNLANHLQRKQAISDAKSLAFTWGSLIIGGALEMSGPLFPVGAWIQGAAIGIETLGSVAITFDMYQNSDRLQNEAKVELLSAMSQGGDKELIHSSLSKSENSRSISSSAELMIAFSALNSLRLVKGINLKRGSTSLSASESADNIILKNYYKSQLEKEMTSLAKNKIPSTLDSGYLKSIEAKLGKKTAEKFSRYADALNPDLRVKLLNAVEKNQVKNLLQVTRLPCFSKKVSTKCLEKIDDLIQQKFNDAHISFNVLNSKKMKFDKDFFENLSESNFSQMEVNQLARVLPNEKISQEALEDLKEYLQYISHEPLAKRMAAIEDSKIIIKGVSEDKSKFVTSFRKNQSKAIVKEKAWFKEEVKKLENDASVEASQVEKLATTKASLKRQEWLRRSAACDSKIPNTYSTEGTSNFVKLQQYAGPAYSAANFILSHLEEEKNSQWFKELGWEFVTSIVYGRIPGLILKNKMDTFVSKNIKETVVSMGVGLADSRIYHMFIRNKNTGEDFESKLKDPKVQKSLLEMAKKIEQISQEDEFKKIIESQAKTNAFVSESSDEETLEYLKENFSNDQLEKMYGELKSGDSPKKKIISTGSSSNDLFVYNNAWAFGISVPKRILVQKTIQRLMCMGDTKTGIAVYTIDRLLSGQLYYKGRDIFIGQ